jgi:hypothetical protein
MNTMIAIFRIPSVILFCFSRLKIRGLLVYASILKKLAPIRPVSKSFMLSKKRSNRLYALGSGSSICDYSCEMWAEIGSHDSLGFNFWCLHRFVPSFYVVESAVSSSQTCDLHSNLLSILGDYANTLFLWKDDSAAFLYLSMIKKIGAYLVKTRSYSATSKEKLVRNISRLNRTSRARFCVYTQGSTLDWILDFALLMGYEELVLCGFDLSDSRYFYTSSACKALNAVRPSMSLPAFSFDDETRPHLTADPSRCCGALDALTVCSCYKDALSRANLKVSVGSSKSLLATVWPLHQWEAFSIR